MRLTLLLMGLGISGIFAVGTMLAQTAPATAAATKPAVTAPATASATASKPATTTATSAPTTASTNASCLRCHPWDKVVAASKDYVTPEGIKGNPHYYVPHDSKKVEDIPDCLKCHTKHAVSPMPKKGEIDLKKVTIKWCYDVCHHEKNLDKCNKCH